MKNGYCFLVKWAPLHFDILGGPLIIIFSLAVVGVENQPPKKYTEIKSMTTNMDMCTYMHVNIYIDMNMNMNLCMNLYTCTYLCIAVDKNIDIKTTVIISLLQYKFLILKNMEFQR